MMNRDKIRFIRTSGPFGDATSNYDVNSSAKTVGEFVNAVLEDTREYGDFDINGQTFEYRYGNLLNGIPDKLLDSEIDYPVKANGGWSLMSYKIKLKGYEDERND